MTCPAHKIAMSQYVDGLPSVGQVVREACMACEYQRRIDLNTMQLGAATTVADRERYERRLEAAKKRLTAELAAGLAPCATCGKARDEEGDCISCQKDATRHL